jgi:tetratricopeptide (TPR) repeat protein
LFCPRWWAIVVFAGCAEQQNNKPQSTGGQDSKWVKMEPSEIAQAQKAKQPEINPTTYFAAGVLLENQGNFTGAIEKFNKTIDMDPTYQSAYNHLEKFTLNSKSLTRLKPFTRKRLSTFPMIRPSLTTWRSSI